MKPVVAHLQYGNGHAVAAQMRVLITPSPDGGFVAQGLDIDYCATGATIDEAQQHFADGFLRTVTNLLRKHRPLSSLFASRTPPEIWQEYMDSKRQDELLCGAFVDLLEQLPKEAAAELPFERLAFCAAPHAHAA